MTNDGPPKKIAIDHDDHHAKHVGRTVDGRQFFLTTPFVPAFGLDPGREFLALFVFDADGKLLKATIDDLGVRGGFDPEAERSLVEQRLASLGDVTYDRIEVAPFSVTRFGIEFGLIPRAPEDDEDTWAVDLLPGNYMAFFEPWDSGDYDT